ncbi:MAG: glycosyltransferase family 39 protein [Bacteroidota bacterium]
MSLKDWFLIIFLLILAYFPIFWKLDSHSLYHWDEARNALNANEMYFNGNYLVRHYMGAPDQWETKPPLLTWLQVSSLKIVGFNELAIRLPIALFALGTVLMIFFFFRNVLQESAAGFFASLTLVTTNGYIHYHVARNGDHDTVLIFFLVALLLSFYRYLQEDTIFRGLLCGLLLALAVLTKSIAGLFFLPGLLLYTILSGKLLQLCKRKSFYLGLGLCIGLVATYYLAANAANPSYLTWVWNNELLPRFFNLNDDPEFVHLSDKLYYFNILKGSHFKYYFWFLIIPLLLLCFHKKLAHKSFYLLLAITAFSFLFLISLGTKKGWYATPAYPLLAMLIGMGLAESIRLIGHYAHLKIKTAYLYIPMALLFFALPYQQMIQKIDQDKGSSDKYGELLEHLEKIAPTQKAYFVLYQWRNSSYLWYEQVYERIKGFELESCGFRNSLEDCQAMPEVGQQAIVSSAKMLEELQTAFHCDCIAYFNGYQVCTIVGKK